MLFKYHNRSAIQAVILTSLLLAGCGNSAAIESLVSADPRLKEIKQQSQATRLEASQDSAPVKDNDSLSATPPSGEAAAQSSVPSNFPASFPVYPQAKLQETKSEGDNSGMLVWNTTDNRKAVADYYQTELLANDWEIIKPFTLNPEQKIARAIAVKDDLKVEMTLLPLAEAAESDNNNTQLSVSYRPRSQDIPESEIQATNPAENSQPAQNNQGQTQQPTQRASSSKPNNQADFADLDEVSEQLQQPLESVAALGVLTPYTGEANVELSKFAPNKIITRGEYARWLITANNRYYSDNPGKKIYVATETNQPAFQDVKPNDPDFAAIQSLAEAGLIPSRLTEDNTNLLFRPDAPLTREDLITWKVPLDTRQSLPKASIEAIEESWGFQDAESIDSAAIRALYADFQNGDRSNIRRIFGYTTLFQPKKPITRAEAGASLWYFGFQGDGITAREVLDSTTDVDS